MIVARHRAFKKAISLSHVMWRSWASRHVKLVMCFGIFTITIGTVFMIMITLSATSIVILGSIMICTGFSTMIARDTGALCDIYMDHIQFHADILLEYPETDRLVSMAINAKPVSWKHPALKTTLIAIFIIMAIVGMISWSVSIIDDVVLVIVTSLVIVVATSTFRVEFASAVQNNSKANLLERAVKYLEKCY